MRILVAYDGSLSADAAVEDLRRAGLPEQAEALVVCVGDGALPPPDVVETDESDTSWRSKVAGAEALARRAAARLQSYFPRWTVSSEALWGSPAKILLDTAQWWHPDLIVVGSHGHSPVVRLFLGSVSMECLHNAPCSVRVVRPGTTALSYPLRIVIGNDGSAEAQSVIRSVAARSWPEATQAQIVSVVQTLVPVVVTTLEASTYAQEPAYSVIREADEQLKLQLKGNTAEAANTLRRAGLIVGSEVIEGDPREAILAAAEDSRADCIFVGARGLGRMARLLLGSVSSYVVTHAPCAVEVVRNAGA